MTSKPTREWCKVARTHLLEKTTKKKIRCKECGRLLYVHTNGIGEEPIGEQYIPAHKGKYE